MLPKLLNVMKKHDDDDDDDDDSINFLYISKPTK